MNISPYIMHSYSALIFALAIISRNLPTCKGFQGLVERRQELPECGTILETIRLDCGYGGITPNECTKAGCCFLPTDSSGIPWCFYRNETAIIHRTTTQPSPVTTMASMKNQTPDWLKKLIGITKELRNQDMYPTTIPTTTESTDLSILTILIEDELMCQKTNRLYDTLRDARGESTCSTDLDERVPCVKGKLKKEKGQSECSACVKLSCCYDPMIKKNGGNIAPHCYKERKLVKTTTSTTIEVTTTTPPDKIWSGINPAFQPGQKPGLSLNISTGLSTLLKNFLSNRPGTQQQVSSGSIFGTSLPSGSLLGTGGNTNIFSSLSSLRRPTSGGSSSLASSDIISQVSSGTQTNPLSILSLLQKPKAGETQKTSSTSNAVLALWNKLKNSTSISNLLSFSSLLKPSTGLAGGSSSASLLPSTTLPTSSTGSFLSNLLSGQSTTNSALMNLLLGNNKQTSFGGNSLGTSALLSLINKPSSGQTSSGSGSTLSNLLSSYGQSSTSGSTSSVSSILNYLNNRNKPNVTTHNTTFKNQLSNNFLQNKFGTSGSNSGLNSLFTNLILGSKVGASTNQPSTVKNISNAEVPKQPSGISLTFETAQYPLPRTTCYPKNECGQRATDGNLTHRIVGGQWAGAIEYWPWTASLRRAFSDDDRFIHICGATLIARQWFITAGHCFMAYKSRGKKLLGEKEEFKSVYSLHLGKYYRDVGQASMRVFELDSFYPHPDYDFKTLSNDFAVAKLKEPVARYSNYIQPACLPGKRDFLYTGEACWITGWGDTLHVGGQDQSKLKELSLPLISTESCKKTWPEHFHDSWICTAAAYLEDACAGDSGGPLVMQNSEGRWELIGVAIAGTRSCSTDKNDIKPGIYAKVAYYRDFIDSVTKGACDEPPRGA
ncbi:uncharacterized protein LOC143445484 [Clavelina lepadiformis]|uniref:Uncharacterized protein n=1 Tax=Clavelina lepadiformis TaxID=159417 RepID=A0ABP0GSH1_CLALP